MHLSLRFDFRNPAFANTSMSARYAAAIDMAEWADGLSIPVTMVVSEHHGSEDGYCPCPQLLLAAMAARSRNVRFNVSALIAPFHDPLLVAEEYCVLDHISKGRVDIVVGGGYAPSEFAMFDVPLKERPKRVTEVVKTMKAAFTGEPFEYRGRTVQITPAPYTPGGPKVMMGGASEGAARRAARIADGFIPSAPFCWDFYRDELVKLGKQDPGPFPGHGQTIALARDPKAGWDAMVPFFLHETNAYGAWKDDSGEKASDYETFADGEALRSAGIYNVMTPEQMVAQLKAAPYPVASLHPLCGGMPIDLAWDGLRLFEKEVLPAFR